MGLFSSSEVHQPAVGQHHQRRSLFPINHPRPGALSRVKRMRYLVHLIFHILLSRGLCWRGKIALTTIWNATYWSGIYSLCIPYHVITAFHRIPLNRVFACAMIRAWETKTSVMQCVEGQPSICWGPCLPINALSNGSNLHWRLLIIATDVICFPLRLSHVSDDINCCVAVCNAKFGGLLKLGQAASTVQG